MFSPNFPPIVSPEAYVNGKFGLASLQTGWIVDVVSIQNQTNLFKEDKGSIWDPLVKMTHPSPGFGPNRLTPFIGRRLSFEGMWTYHAIKTGLRLAKQNKYGIILSRSLPVLAHLPALIVKRKIGTPWIANWNDPSPAHRCPVPYGQGPQASAPFHWKLYHDLISKSADWHTFPSKRLMDYMVLLHPGMKGKTSDIPHAALSLKTDKKSPTGKFKLLFAGDLSSPRSPVSFFQGLLRFFREDATSCLAQLEIEFLLNRAMDFEIPEDLSRVVSISFDLSYSEVIESMRRADVLLIIEAPVENGIFLPSKFVDCVQCRRPILAISPKQGTVADLLIRHGGGLIADCTSPEEIAQAFSLLYSTWRNGLLDQQFGTDSLYSVFSGETIFAEYDRLISNLISKQRSSTN